MVVKFLLEWRVHYAQRRQCDGGGVGRQCDGWQSPTFIAARAGKDWRWMSTGRRGWGARGGGFEGGSRGGKDGIERSHFRDRSWNFRWFHFQYRSWNFRWFHFRDRSWNFRWFHFRDRSWNFRWFHFRDSWNFRWSGFCCWDGSWS